MALHSLFIAERLSVRLMIARADYTRLSDGVFIGSRYNFCNAYAHAVAMHVIRVPGGSGRSYAWGWNPNLECIQRRTNCA